MSIEIEEIIAQLKDVHRGIFRRQPGDPGIDHDRDRYLRLEKQLLLAIDGLCNPTETREKRFTLTFSLEGEDFQAKGNRLNLERVITLLQKVAGCIATSHSTTHLFKGADGNLFGEIRISWPQNNKKSA